MEGGNRLAIDLGDDVATAEAQVVSEARGIDFGDEHTALALHADARGALRREAVDAQAEFGRGGFPLLVVQAACLRREYRRAGFDNRRGVLLPAVTQVGELNLA